MGKAMWASWSRTRRIVFVSGAVFIVLVASVAGWWATRTPYGVLFSQLKDVDAAEIATALDGWQTPHRYADGGTTLLVPEDAVYDTRMKLVSQGIPHGGSVGFEVFKDSDFGVTEFAQRVNYQRALQGELERTIDTIADVQSSRVHLTLRKAGMFDSAESPSKASVSLTFRPGAQLSRSQVAGIQRLVASAVDGLTPDAVAVIGEGGVALSAQGAGDNGEEQVRVETRLRQRVQDLLRDALAIDAGSTVSVDVTLNYDRVRQVHERLLEQGKDGNGLLVRQRTANSHLSSGSASNADEPARPQGSGETETEYAHGREQEEVERAPGRIQRLSVGVVVPAGTPQASVTALYDLIAAAVGIDASRGDRLNVVAMGAVPPALVATTRSIPSKAAPLAVPRGTAAADDRLALIIALGAAICIALVAVIAWLLARRRKLPARLTHERREALLGEVRHWLDTRESVR
jgi:flagellar M-ring protein FliF